MENQDEQQLQEALAEYNAAATGYREYISNYPNSPNAYELQYNLADALFWSGQYEEAATVYAAVRDSNLDNAHLSESARRVVESLKRLVDDAAAAGRLTLRGYVAYDYLAFYGPGERFDGNVTLELGPEVQVTRWFYVAAGYVLTSRTSSLGSPTAWSTAARMTHLRGTRTRSL